MRWKKTIVLMGAAVMALSLIGCGQQDADTDTNTNVHETEAQSIAETPVETPAVSAETEGETATVDDGGSAEGEIEEILFAVPISKNVDLGKIEEEMNKITESKINVRVKLEGVTMSNYNNQVGLMMAGNEQLDIIGMSSFGDYSSMLARNQLMNMDNYIDVYASETRAVLGETFLKATSSSGSIYALPTNNGKAAAMNIVLRKDLIDELDLPVDHLTQAANYEEYFANLDLITEMFAKINEAHSEMVCLVPSSTNPNNLGFNLNVPFIDNLNDSNGVLMPGESSTVENWYESAEFKTLCEYAYSWNQAGYILEDATTTQETYNTYMQNNRTAGLFVVGEEGQAEQITTATGVAVDAFKIVEAYIVTSNVNGVGFAISANSQQPEAAMKFLNEMYTNPDVLNLLDWGIEGIHYEVKDDGTIDFPVGLDANSTTYGLNQDWLFGNQFISYIWGEGRDTTIYSRLEENNKNANYSPVMGFSYDNTKVSSEIAAISNVIDQYLPGLSCGTLDPETELIKFQEALMDAGLQKVMEEKQKQLNAWIVENQ